MKQLEIFACVCRTLSFSKAAESMYLSQPTVSACVSALEKELGVQLLIRSTREAALTKDGRALLGYAESILSLREQAVTRLSGENRELPGGMDIIASTIPAQHLLPDMLASFRRAWPGMVFRVAQADSRKVEREMSGFRYEFGMMGTIPSDGRLVHFPVYDDELVLVIPVSEANSPEEIRAGFADYIREVPFVWREPGSGTRAEIEALLERLGVPYRELRQCAIFSDAQSILGAVSRGMGVSLVSRVAAALHVQAGLIQMVAMESPLFHRQIHLVVNRERQLSPVQKAFADHARGFWRTHSEKG